MEQVTWEQNARLELPTLTLLLHFTSPYYNESHIHLRKVMREFVDKEITPFCHEWSEAKAIPRSVVKKCGEIGILAAISGAATNPSVDHLLPYPLPAGLTRDQFDIFHEFICVDELSRCGSGGTVHGKEPRERKRAAFTHYWFLDRSCLGCWRWTCYCK